jgi:hypothetical protein
MQNFLDIMLISHMDFHIPAPTTVFRAIEACFRLDKEQPSQVFSLQRR